jgi:hypothetical protein
MGGTSTPNTTYKNPQHMHILVFHAEQLAVRILLNLMPRLLELSALCTMNRAIQTHIIINYLLSLLFMCAVEQTGLFKQLVLPELGEILKGLGWLDGDMPQT